jgi:hypothetical protein
VTQFSAPAIPKLGLRPIGLGLMAIGLASLVWLIAIGPSFTSLTCQRSTSVTCRLTQRSLIGIPWQQRSIKQFQGAQLNSDRTNAPGYVYRMTLHTFTETIALAPYSNDIESCEGLRTRITTFLKDSKIKVLNDGTHVPIPLMVGLLGGAIGLTGLGRVLMWLGS